MGDAVPVFIHFPQKALVQSLALGEHPVRRGFFRIPIQGEKLSIPGKIPSSHQVNVSAVFPQTAAGGIVSLLLRRVCLHLQSCAETAIFLAAVNGVTVGVKIRYFQFASTSNAFFI